MRQYGHLILTFAACSIFNTFTDSPQEGPWHSVRDWRRGKLTFQKQYHIGTDLLWHALYVVEQKTNQKNWRNVNTTHQLSKACGKNTLCCKICSVAIIMTMILWQRKRFQQCQQQCHVINIYKHYMLYLYVGKQKSDQMKWKNTNITYELLKHLVSMHSVARSVTRKVGGSSWCQ